MDPAAITRALVPCLIAGFAYNMVTAYLYGKRAQAKIRDGILDRGEDSVEGDSGLTVEGNRNTKLNIGLIWPGRFSLLSFCLKEPLLVILRLCLRLQELC